MLTRVSRLFGSRDGDGQGLTEYMLVLVVISLLGIYFCISTGNDTKRLISNTSDSLSTIS